MFTLFDAYRNSFGGRDIILVTGFQGTEPLDESLTFPCGKVTNTQDLGHGLDRGRGELYNANLHYRLRLF